MNLPKKSIKYKIPIVLLVISLFPFLVLGAYTLKKSSEIAQEQAFSLEIEYLSRSSLQLEDYLDYAQSYFTSITTQRLLSKYIYGTLNYREYSSLVQVQRWLNDFLSPYDLLDTVYFVNFEQNYVIGNNITSYFLETDETNPLYLLLEESAQKQQTIFWTYIAPWEGLQRNEKQENIKIQGITLFIKCPMYSNSRQSAILISLNSEHLISFLERVDGRSPLIIIDENNTIIHHEDSSCIGMDLSAYPFLSEMDFSEDKGSVSVSGEDKPVYVSYLKGSNGWLYVTLNEASVINGSVSSVYPLYFLVGGLAILILFILVLQIWHWLYTPIDRAEKQLFFFQNNLKELFFLKIIENSLTEEEIQRECSLLHLDSSYSQMAVMAFQYIRSPASEMETGFLENAKDIWQLLPMDQVIASTIYKGLFVVLLGNTQNHPDFTAFLMRLGEVITEKVTLEQQSIAIGISECVTDFTQIRKAYLGSVNALTYRTETENNILLAVPQNSITDDRSTFPGALTEMLVFAIRNGSEEEARQLISRVSESIYSRRLDHQIYEAYILRIAAAVLAAIDELDITDRQIAEILPEHWYDDLLRIHNASSMNHIFTRDLIIPLTKWISSYGANVKHSLSQNIIQMIRQEFNTDLTIEICAERLHYHSAYLRQVFKEQTQISFSQYLKDYRFHMAKKYLRETNKSVAEIAAELRYSNPQNFIRSFKKKTGTTPETYRKENC